MNKKRYFRLLVGVFLLLLVSLVPRNVMAEGDSEYYTISINFLNIDGEKIKPEIYYSGNLENIVGDGFVIDFTSDNYKHLGTSGKLVYNKDSNTLVFDNINNKDSEFLMDIEIYIDSSKETKFNLVGDNLINGSLYFMYNGGRENIITGDGSLNITSYAEKSCLQFYQGKWKILNTNINLKNIPKDKVNQSIGLQSNADSMEIINSTINIQSVNSESSNKVGLYGIIAGPIDFTDSKVFINLKGSSAFGLNADESVSFNSSYVKIDVEGNQAHSIEMFQYHKDVVLDILNSEVYLNSKSSTGGSTSSLGASVKGKGYFDQGSYGTYINVSESIFQTQGDTNAILGNLKFRENINKVYVKENLWEEKVLFPINNKADKEKLGTTREMNSPYKYVRIEPKLKSFEIDADSQPVDQNSYVFDHWDAKGFIVEHPTSKKTTVKIPVIWPKGAYLNAVWRKIDTSNNPKAEVIYQAIPMTFTDVKTVYKTTRLDMAYLKGYPDKTIHPEGNMTRAEAVTTLVRLERYKGKDARDLKENNKPIYADVEAGIWYKKYIDYAYAQGWLEEKEGQMFYPNRLITRAELAQLISHVDKNISKPAPFTDIEGHPFKAAIDQAYANGRIKGYEDNTFRPDGNIKRVEVATMLNRLYNRQADKSFINNNQDLITKFKDLDSSHWGYYELVEAFESHQAITNEDGSEEWQRLIGGSI